SSTVGRWSTPWTSWRRSPRLAVSPPHEPRRLRLGRRDGWWLGDRPGDRRGPRGRGRAGRARGRPARRRPVGHGAHPSPRRAGGGAVLVEADVSRWADVDRAVTEAVRALGPLGVMVNAAGVLDGYTPADQMSPALWEKVVAIDLTGTFWGCKRALAELLPAGR